MSARADADALLDASVEHVRGVSASRAALLAKMGVRSVRDMLSRYPNRYLDLSNIVHIAQAPIGDMLTVVGQVHEIVEKRPRPRLDILEVSIVDDTGVLVGVWFSQPWMARRFEKGARVAFSGKVGFDYGFKRMNAPIVEFLDDAADAPTATLVAVHQSSQDVSSAWMRRFIANALEQCADISDPLPAWLRVKRALESKKEALLRIHFPKDADELARARRRLAYEELLCLQLAMMLRRDASVDVQRATAHRSAAAWRRLRAALPFELTDEQESAIAEIRADMCASRCMNRMLLGDVGTGKTVVAAFSVALCADTGCQCALMAPTEVLATQHAHSLGALFDACGVSWALLTGSTPAHARAETLAAVADGSLCCLIGTHALIEPDVRFANFTLAVIDEQHRFGVRQREALRAKGPAADLLMLTATPIPRTLALAYYGDLDTSYLRKRPQNRPAPLTRVISRDERHVAYEAIRQAVARGRQAYIICPLVGLSRKQRAERAQDGRLQDSLATGHDISDAKAAEQEAARLAAHVFPELDVGLLTGHMSPSEKRDVMACFSSGAISILVATTVVEVGLDVANAAVMLIEDAERFGLAQLHQLRGRVARGAVAGQVFLVADPGKDDDELRARLDAIVSSSDGFELAQADLEARREGSVLGRRQHGAGMLKLADVVRDADLVAMAHADAALLLERDPGLASREHAALARETAVSFADSAPTTTTERET